MPRTARDIREPRFGAGLAQPDRRVRRGGARPARRQPRQLADAPGPAARRPARLALRGRLGPAGHGQPAHGLRRGRPRPRRGGAQPPRADRAGALRRPVPRRGAPRPRHARPARRDGGPGRRAGSTPCWPSSRSATRASQALLDSLATAAPRGLTDPDDVPEPPAEPWVKPGELYRLGEHRLLCGDATNPDDVARLLDGRGADAARDRPALRRVSLDPTWRDGVYNALGPAEAPYMRVDGQDDGGSTPPKRPVRAPWANRGPPQHHDLGRHPGRLVRGVRPRPVPRGRLRLARRRPRRRGGRRASSRIGFEIVAQVIWDKGLFAMGRSWYHWRHEPCWVVRRPGVPNLFIGERDQSHGLAGAPPEDDHGAARPRRSSTTRRRSPSCADRDPDRATTGGRRLRALRGLGHHAHRGRALGRRCYAMEIEPRYVQVAHRALAGLHRPEGGADRWLGPPSARPRSRPRSSTPCGWATRAPTRPWPPGSAAAPSRSGAGVIQRFCRPLKRPRREARLRFVGIIATAARTSWQAAAWFLERRVPAEWGRRESLDVAVDAKREAERLAGELDGVSVEDLDRRGRPDREASRGDRRAGARPPEPRGAARRPPPGRPRPLRREPAPRRRRRPRRSPSRTSAPGRPTSSSTPARAGTRSRSRRRSPRTCSPASPSAG